MYSLTELCRRTGISARTLRHYERLGLLSPTATTEHGRRFYGGRELEVIAELQMLGILGHALSRRPAVGHLDEVCRQLQRHLDAMEQSVAAIRAEISRLARPGEGCLGDEVLLGVIRALVTGTASARTA
ncbi:MerR family transcriptional regulator [Microbacterium sp. CFH 90308]|uniref:MerR family transcriptional regulator n=1 Tax=Microbacterium salsuginis TaxID=2722803 RepID=A0ABX1KDR7_9MICO|nr:MerR family transcriptional regulator [Microbacterium sp. CFH 90308]